MFRWLRRRRRYRNLFKYWSGDEKGWISDDPLAIARRIDCDPEFRPERHLELVERGDNDSVLLLMRTVCRAFNVAPYDPATQNGLTEFELMGLYIGFNEYMEDLKKNIGFSSTPSPSSETSTSSSSNAPITNGTAPSLPISNASPSAAPT